MIDDEFLRRLAPLYPNAVVIDRDGREFHERFDLLEIIRIAGLPIFTDIRTCSVRARGTASAR